MKKTISFFMFLIALSGCVKEPKTNTTEDTIPSSEVLSSFASNVAKPVYQEMFNHTEDLNNLVQSFCASPNDIDLASCRLAWKDTRNAWEHSEAFLFGPVATENIDPRIDTWPVNFQDLEGELAGTQIFTAAYIDGLQDALKGFHPIEYLLFGLDGNKTSSSFTTRELEFLSALSTNLLSLVTELNEHWNGADSFGNYLSTAGSGNLYYPTYRSAYEEIVNAMIGICDEVAAGKIGEPFLLQDPSLEESPYSKNSIIDFSNNIKGVEAVYKGQYLSNGKGLEDLVREYNLSLDSEIKSKIATALSALSNITLPFGEAIINQPQQVQSAITAIENLKTTLEEDLLPLIQQKIKD